MTTAKAGNRVLVIGFGSIGRRHAGLLAAANASVSVVSRHASAEEGYRIWHSLDDALASDHPAAIVVANITSEHRATLSALAERGFAGRVLVEKPIFDRNDALPVHRFERLAVGYNLRFHPLIAKVRDAIGGKTILSVDFSCGQYLPLWRPAADYRTGYSASREQGGGVLRDLSHELDCLLHLFGPWASLTAAGGRRGTLEISSDDVWSIVCELSSGAIASVHLDYWNRPAHRTIRVETTETSITADLIAGTFCQDGQTQTIPVQRDESYRSLHAAFLGDDASLLCSAEEALNVMKMIEAVETAGRDKIWVKP